MQYEHKICLMLHVGLNPRAYVSSLSSVSIKRPFFFRRSLLSNALSTRLLQRRSPAWPMWVVEASPAPVLALAPMPVQERALRALSLSVRSPLASSGSNTDLVRRWRCCFGENRDTHKEREKERNRHRCQYHFRSITRMHAQSYHIECILYIL